MSKTIFNNGLIDLAQPRLGSKVIFKTDDFFASAKRIINPLPPIFKEGLFDNNGKWMDGWETRRKRIPGNDYIIIKLGKPGKIDDILIDTSFFNGNQPEFTTIEGCYTNKKSPKKSIWKNILKKKKLYPNKKHFFKSNSNKTFNFVRFNIFPDGGVARLKLYGNIDLSKEKLPKNIFDLASVLNGSKIIACSDEHFGKAENLLSPGKSTNMGNGWETKRRRGQGYDWVILRLGTKGLISHFEINTHYFKGNYPSHFSIQICSSSNFSSIKKIVKDSLKWKVILKNIKLKADNKLIVKNNFNSNVYTSLIKLNIHPDGGISRFRVFGTIK